MPITQKHRNKGVVLILLSTIMFGSYGVWSKLMGSYFGNFYQAWTRAFVISLILLPVLIWKKELIRIQKKDYVWIGAFLVVTSATQAPLFYAYTHMDIGTASLLFFVTMLLTMYLVGFLILKEKVSKLKLISFVVALLGLAVTFSFSLQQFSILAAFMAILNGVMSGTEVSFSKKLSDKYSPLYLTFLSWLVVFPSSFLVSRVIHETQLLPSLDVHWLWLIGYVIASLFGFWFVIAGLQYVESSIGGLMGLLEIVFSVVFGIVLFGEPFTMKIAIGAAIILFAASLPHVSDLLHRNKRIA